MPGAVQAHFGWPLPTSVGVQDEVAGSARNDQFTVTTPVPSAIETPDTYFVAPGKA